MCRKARRRRHGPARVCPAHDKIFAALLALDLPSFQTRQQIEDALAPEIPNLVLRRFLLKNLGRNAAGSFIWKINLDSLAKNYLKLGEPVATAAPFAKPTLFIRGGKSNYIKAEDELFPRANIQTIVGASHWVHTDEPEKFLRLLLEFL